MNNTKTDTHTGLASCYDEPATIPAHVEHAPADQPLVHRINALDERVRSNVSRMKRYMALSLSAAAATGSMLCNFKATHARDYGRFFEDEDAPGNFSFSRRAADNYCKLYIGVDRLAAEQGVTEQLHAEVAAYCRDEAETIPLLEKLLQSNSLRGALQELGALPAPPAPTLGERLDNAGKQGELQLTWEEKRTRSWTRWGGCCEQLETYIEESATALSKTDREAAAARLEDMASRLRAMPA